MVILVKSINKFYMFKLLMVFDISMANGKLLIQPSV
ncbi:hypothetical protein ATK78_1069 [Pedobacter metabolipauper]|uniref:Uncharacterized protein n=1 Tax=Pedobacter metabolipauper TaxID=425513 RepID=A0A4R6T1I6_9SPHI|nr:hypothetical protein ATK78_1069 [Pedobacter metabolipauper]